MRYLLQVSFCVILCFLAIYWSSSIDNFEARKINTATSSTAPKARFLINNVT